MDDDSPNEVPPRVAASSVSDIGPRRQELRRVADATRALIEGLVGTDLNDAAITATADALERLAEQFLGDGPRSMYDGIAEAAMAGDDSFALLDHSPLIGGANPLAPPIVMSVEGDAVVGKVCFGAAYEGPPGCVHGGYIAAAFDEVLGSAQSLGGSPGMTGTLSIRYQSPTPLHADLRFVGRFDRKEGRKVFTTGQLFAGDTITATAEGLFISIDPERFRQLNEDREARLNPAALFHPGRG